jgi:hypothetical protein
MKITYQQIKQEFDKNKDNLKRGCKTKNYPDGNDYIAWERFKNKYEPVSALSMLKLEKQFRELSLKNGQDPEIRITELESLCVKLENMGSCMTENQFMIHMLNNFTSEYKLQLAMMKRRVGDADKPLTVEEVRGELNLRFERLNMKTSRYEEGEVLEEQALLSGQGHGTGTNFCSYCRAMKRRFASNSRRRKRNMAMPVILTVTLTGEITSHKM